MSKSQTDSSGVIAEIQAKLKESLNEATFSLWFEPLVWSLQEDTLTLTAPDRFFKAHFEREFFKQVTDTLKEISSSVTVKLVGPKLPVLAKSAPNSLPVCEKKKYHAPLLPGVELSLMKAQIPKNKTFDTLIVEECRNNLAVSVCQGIKHQTSIVSGSILLHGPSGSGKSHLLYAIANEFLAEKKDVLYTTATDFKDRFVLSAGSKTPFGTAEALHKRFSECDILLLDNIETLTGKPKTKEAIIRIVETLRKSAVVVTASTLSPRKLQKKIGHGDKCNEGARLVAMLSGVAFAIQPPSKTALIKRKAENFQLILGDEALEYLVATINGNSHITANILRTLASYKSVGENITLAIVKQLVEDFLGKESAKLSLTLEIIEDMVCENFKVDLSDLQSKSRKRMHTMPRNVAMYLMRELTPHSLAEIGERFNRSHATALKAHTDISETCIRDKSLDKQIEILQKKLEVYRIEI